jgi:dCMP deaminase
MATQTNLDRAYMECAFAIAKVSRAKRRKVGAIVVAQNGGILAEGVNGMPSGFSNECEDRVLVSASTILKEHGYDHENYQLVTKDECLHAESNAITKVARSHNSSVGATLYCTLSPCFECAKLIIQAGIVRVVYAEQYPYPGHTGPSRKIGLDLLREAKIQVDNLPLSTDHDDGLTLQDEGHINYDDKHRWPSP